MFGREMCSVKETKKKLSDYFKVTDARKKSARSTNKSSGKLPLIAEQSDEALDEESEYGTIDPKLKYNDTN